MGNILSSWGVELTVVFTLCIIILLGLYIMSIIWVSRDSYLRDANTKLWTLVAIIPILGVIAYCLMRPPMYQIDRDEQQLEIALKKRQLMQYGECAKCGYPVEWDYVICPKCNTQLKNLCHECGKALHPKWRVCPYCATSVKSSKKKES